MSSVSRKLKCSIMAVITGGVVLVTPVIGASSAQAAPWNCPINGQGLSRSTICYQGSGEYR